jgi:sporulation protein YlmC with PRC-barrel domain
VTYLTDPLHLDLHLMDRQVVDDAGNKIGKVDDVELGEDDGRLVVTALLVGQRFLGERIGGWVGTFLAGIATRLGGPHEPRRLRIPFEQVTHVDSEVIIGLHDELLPTPPLEAWLRDKLIDRIPGARDEGE